MILILSTRIDKLEAERDGDVLELPPIDQHLDAALTRLEGETKMNEPKFESMEQLLLEFFGEWLDDPQRQMDMALARVKDPFPPHETELHIRMAKAAMDEFRRSVVAVTPATRN